MRVIVIGLAFLVYSSPLLSAAQTTPTVADLVDKVKGSVVQVAVALPGVNSDSSFSVLSEGERSCFINSTCIIGSGFFVNANGDLVTAAHVAQAVQGITSKLRSSGTNAGAFIGVGEVNFENDRATVSSNVHYFPIVLVSIDVVHDLAVFHSVVNPFTSMRPMVSVPGFPHTTVSAVVLAKLRPRDAEEVFACGFPFGVASMVTTSGSIGSAWNHENLITAKAAGINASVEVYQADLRINPGNSGGPVFRIANDAVVGVVVELHGTIDIVVPSKYIVSLLSDLKIPFSVDDSNKPIR